MIVLTSIFIIVLISAYYLYLKPIKIIQKYAKDFASKGYKVATFPYKPYDVPAITSLFKDKSGDPLSIYKTQYLSYDIIIGNYLTKPMLIFLSPQIRKQLSKHQIDYDYIKLPAMSTLYSDVIGNGLIFSEGDIWKRKRRLLSRFFSFDFLQKLIPEISKICEKCFNEIQVQSLKKVQSIKQYQFKLLKLTVRVFSSVILSIFLGAQSLEEKINGQSVCYFMVNLVADNSVQANKPLSNILGPKYLKLGLTEMDRKVNRNKIIFNQWANQYIDKFIQKSRPKTAEPTNLLELLLNSSNKQEKYTKKELIQELKLFFFAGSDTTSHLAQMMVYYAALNPQITKKVRDEINSIHNIRSSQDLKKAVYIQSIFKETTRYYGPLPLNFVREATKSHSFNGIAVNQGTCGICISASTHFSEQYFSKPEEYRPERWLQQNKTIDSACLVGFGMGLRNCIGQHLANIESKIFFFEFFKRYERVQVPEKVHFVWKFMNEVDNLYVNVKKIRNDS